MFCLKINLKSNPTPEKLFSEFGKLKRLCFNRFVDGLSFQDALLWFKDNVEYELDRSFLGWAMLDAKGMYDSHVALKTKTPVFGGKKNFKLMSEKKMTKDEWKKLRNSSILVVGSKCDYNGNRKVKLDVENNKLYFNVSRTEKYILELENFGEKRKKQLLQIQKLAEIGECPITYRIKRDSISISIDENIFKNHNQPIKQDRIAALDLNPNYIALVIKDVDKLVHQQIFDLRKLNKIGSTTKKHHELVEVSKSIAEICSHLQVEIIGVEQLEIKVKDHNKGKYFNKLINNTWNKKLLINNLCKRCNLLNIRLIEIAPEYSSFVGCLMNPNDIDSIAAAKEIERRTRLFTETFIKKTLPRNTKILFPEWNSSLMIRWKDDLDTDCSTWKQSYKWFKENPKHSYRVLLTDVKNPKLFRFKSRKSNIFLCFY